MTSDEEGTDAFRLVVVGVDGSVSSLRALVWVARLALATNAEIIAVHAMEPPAFLHGRGDANESFVSEDVRAAWKEWQTDMERVLEDWCTPLRRAGVAHRTTIVEGGPGAVLGLANRAHADAVVVGRNGRGGLAELLLGSFSHHIVHHSSRPVIVVPQEDD